MMEYRVICQADRTIEPAVPHAIWSIQPRLDGLSFAMTRGNTQRWSCIAFDAGGDRSEGLRYALFEADLGREDFDEVRVCLPLSRASLVPVCCSAEEYREGLLSIQGVALAPQERIISIPCGKERSLLTVMPAEWEEWFRSKFGEKVVYSHPLAVSLTGKPENNRLEVDVADGFGFFTLTARRELLYADVLPLENEASLLLAVNRIIVGNKVGSVHILLSGEGAGAHAATLGRHYPHVSMDPDGEYRNILRLGL